MDDSNYSTLAKVRLERAEELLKEAKLLLRSEAFKSANNRAFYCVEKSLNALLATEKIQAQTHNGCLKQFNLRFIHSGDGTFSTSDYSIVAQMEQIRNASDYDDFYVASKAETINQVDRAEYFFEKVKGYIDNKI